MTEVRTESSNVYPLMGDDSMETHHVILLAQSWKGDSKADAINGAGTILNVQQILVDGTDVFYTDFELGGSLLTLTLSNPDPDTWRRFEDPRAHLLGSSEESLSLAVRQLEVRYV